MSLNKPESMALIAQNNHVRALFGTRHELNRASYNESSYTYRSLPDRLKELQESNPDSQIVFANPFNSVYEEFPVANPPQEELPLLAFVSKNQNIRQLTRNDIFNALSISEESVTTKTFLSPIEALSHLHDQCGIIHMTRDQAKTLLPDLIPPLSTSIKPEQNDVHFKKRIKQAQEAITNGDISQVVLSRIFQGELENYSPLVAQQVFKNLLQQYGEYMAFLLLDNTSGHALIGASPEQHIKVTKKSRYNEVRHSALAGTLPKNGLTPDTYESSVRSFLADPKEINELAQVTDEDAKNIFPLCEHGHVEGPHLYENSTVFHTGYDIVGHDPEKKHPLDYLKKVPAVATLVGGPMQSALNIQAKTNEPPRRYYGGSIGVLKPNGNMDSAVTIRTAEISEEGQISIQAGAGIVRESIPEKECEETRAKASGSINAFMNTTIPEEPLMGHENQFKKELQNRKHELNTFLRTLQKIESTESLKGKQIVIINNEDNFAHVQAMMIRHMGAHVEVKNMLDICGLGSMNITPESEEELQNADMVILGPGPGNIAHIPKPYFDHDTTTTHTYSMEQVRRLTNSLLLKEIPTLGICLGHQALCQANGLSITKEATAQQGEQREEILFGQKEKVGFYNSFSADIPNESSPNITHTPDSKGKSLMIDGPSFVGVQFHPESLFTKDGYKLLEKLILQTISKNKNKEE